MMLELRPAISCHTARNRKKTPCVVGPIAAQIQDPRTSAKASTTFESLDKTATRLCLPCFLAWSSSRSSKSVFYMVLPGDMIDIIPFVTTEEAGSGDKAS